MPLLLTIDAKHVLKKWSTWLAVATAMCAAGTLAYGALPVDLQQVLPSWFRSVLAFGAVTLPMLVPLATSIQQKSIPEAPTVNTPSNEVMP